MASNCGGAPADERQCICAPTTHTGSFRCRLHRGVGMPRSASFQQFGDAGAPGSSYKQRAASQHVEIVF